MVTLIYTRNTLDCDQSNYSSRIVFSHIPIECGQTGNIVDPPTPKTPSWNQTRSKSDDPSQRYGHLKFSKCEVVGRSSVGPQYIGLLLLTLISYTPLRYVSNVVKIRSEICPPPQRRSKNIKIWVEFRTTCHLIADISGMKQEVVEWKTASQTAISPADAQLIW